MITPKVDDSRIVFGPCRLSYVHVFEKWVPEGEKEGKYSVTILIPKSEKQTLKAINEAIENAKKKAVAAKWDGKEPKKLDIALKDGDEKEDENFAGHWYINAKSNTRPGIIDRHKAPITDEEEMYSGVWAYCSVAFFGYKVSGNAGVAAGLNNLMKFKDDEHFGGKQSADSDFSDIDSEDDDDL